MFQFLLASEKSVLDYELHFHLRLHLKGLALCALSQWKRVCGWPVNEPVRLMIRKF
jgi:hypothetical protein